jgi:hypothetical protein
MQVPSYFNILFASLRQFLLEKCFMNFFLSLGSDLGQAQACCWVQTVNGITTPPS